MFLSEKFKYLCYIHLYNMTILKKKPIIHYPQLDTVLMVEAFIKKHGGEYRKRALWEKLPRKMMYQTFCVIFDYLLSSSKIAVDSDEKVCWIWNPEGVRKYLVRDDLKWRK
jgi:hypothetical protein